MMPEAGGDTADPIASDSSYPTAEPVLGLPRQVAAWTAGLMLAATAYAIAWWGTVPLYTTETQAYQTAAADLFQLRLFPFRTVGYPALLAATGSQVELTPMLFAVQLGMHLATVWMVLLLAKRFSLPAALSIVLGAALLSPPLMEKVSVGVTEASCEFFIVLAALCFVRWLEKRRLGDALAAGFAVAIAGLIRPTYQVLGLIVAIAACAWLWRQGPRVALRASVALALGTVLLVGGMTLVHGLNFGYWGPSPKLGWNLTVKTAPFIEHLPVNEPIRDGLIRWRDESLQADPKGQGLQFIWPRVGDTVDSMSGNPEYGPSNRQYAAASQRMLWINLRLMAAQPNLYARSVATASGNYVLPSATGFRSDPGPIVSLLFVLAHLAVLVAFVAQLFTVSGILMARRLGATVKGPLAASAARHTWWMAVGVVFFTAATSVVIDVGDPRFRTPTDPLILLLVFGGLYSTSRALRGSFSNDVGES